jgi:two-component system cell cycle sensor histidine kinase/response regulator CckA
VRVLAAEDSPTQALRVRADLESQGFDVLLAHDGREALDLARREHPDVILSDILMPEMDGFRLCREMKGDPELCSVPVVLRTGAFLEHGDRNFALESGASAYIEKNMEGGELGSLLREVTKDHVEDPHGQESIEDQTFHGKYQERLLNRLVGEAAAAERSSEELRESQQRLQGILDNSPTFIYAKDLDGRYLLANREFERALGLRLHDVIGNTDQDLFGDQTEQLRDHDRQVIASAKPEIFEEFLAQEDGTHAYLSTKFPLRNVEGSIYAICGISVDVTERKLIEERLRRSEKMEGIGRVAGGVAHDFNNLLGIITSYATFAAEQLDDADQRTEDIDEILKAADRGRKMVKELLTFSRNEEVVADALDVNRFIRELEHSLRTAAGKQVELTVELDAEPSSVRINEARLEQVLLNLVVNARDALSGDGRITMEISKVYFDRPFDANRTLPPGRYVRLTVSDTGFGMSADTMEQIFEPFFTTKDGVGTGLGLATVHGIVEEAGGCIIVESELGDGTTFTIYLPSGDPGTQSASEPGDAVRPDGSQAPRIGPDQNADGS